ncbi:MAG: hypothetical protein IJD00_01215 [Clostridia bacterium]|nr:hypothetical protein [Clostridia bacterium]
MDMRKAFDEHDLIDMMFESTDIDTFKLLWGKDKDAKKWGKLLHSCYWEQSYESVGGDEGYFDDPPINEKRLKYLEELITFLEESGVKAVNDSPGI